jgi:hypothetical protein
MATTECYWRKFPDSVPQCRLGLFLVRQTSFDGKSTIAIASWTTENGFLPAEAKTGLYAWCPIPVDGEIPLEDQLREVE